MEAVSHKAGSYACEVAVFAVEDAVGGDACVVAGDFERGDSEHSGRARNDVTIAACGDAVCADVGIGDGTDNPDRPAGGAVDVIGDDRDGIGVATNGYDAGVIIPLDGVGGVDSAGGAVEVTLMRGKDVAGFAFGIIDFQGHLGAAFLLDDGRAAVVEKFFGG